MISDELRRSQRYIETLGRGRMGEQFLYDELSKRLDGTGLAVRLATEDDHRVPFDLEVLDGNRILVGIENKDLASTTQGTWIKKRSKDLKLEYAARQRIKLIVTTITLKAQGQIGWREGLVNGSKAIFEYDVDRLIKRIVATKEST
jgi:hypothetical protein